MRTLHRSVTGLIASLLVMGGCGLQAPELDEDEFEQMYMVALNGIREWIVPDSPDTLVVDARPRFLSEGESRAIVMGDFNAYGDPALSAAIDEHPLLTACPTECEVDGHDAVTISEVLLTGRRDAALLASRIEHRENGLSSRGFRLRLRFANGAWRVSRIEEVPGQDVVGPDG
jgi:hypothetical protein